MIFTKFKPYGDLLSLHDRVNRLFEDELHNDSQKGSGSFDSWFPATDIFETKDDYIFKLEVPGLNKEDVKVEFQNNTLTVKGEKKVNSEIKKDNFHRVESYSGPFSRSFTLPKNADFQNISASMKDGILELKIAKAEEQKAKSIAIKVD
jgi:HSP20 family protein